MAVVRRLFLIDVPQLFGFCGTDSFSARIKRRSLERGKTRRKPLSATLVLLLQLWAQTYGDANEPASFVDCLSFLEMKAEIFVQGSSDKAKVNRFSFGWNASRCVRNHSIKIDRHPGYFWKCPLTHKRDYFFKIL